MFANDCLDAQGVCPNKVPFLVIGQCTEDTQAITLRDINTGDPIDLTTFGLGTESPSSSSSSSSVSSSSFFSSSSSAEEELKDGVEFTAKALPTDPNELFRKFGVIASEEDAKNGVVQLTLTAQDTEKAGIWCGMAGIWEKGILRKLMPFYLEVQPNLLISNFNGPLTTYELRAVIRDRCALDNFLIDDVEFKTEELHLMMRRVIDEWNEQPPPGFEFTPVDFPYRYNWCNAVIGELLMMAAYQLRRNKLDYTAGGVQVKDEARWEFYVDYSRNLKKDWRKFILDKKLELNIEGGFTSLGGYRHTIPR